MSGQRGIAKISDIQGVANSADIQPDGFDWKTLLDPNRKPASAEDFTQSSVPQGSALGRFASNAGEVLNPMQIIEALNALLHDPVGSAKNVVVAQTDMANKAITSAASGDATRAQGYGLAAMLPVLGPQAAQAGEQIGSGDIAGGLGRGVALAAPVAAEGAIRGVVKGGGLLPSSLRTAAADALDAGAASRVESVMTPQVGANKVRFGNKAAEVAPKLAKDPNMAAYSREGLHGNVQSGLERAKQELDSATDARLVSQQVDTKPILAKLDEQIARLTATPAEGSRQVPTLKGAAGRPVPSGLTRNIESGQMQKAPIKESRPLGQSVEPSPNSAEIDTLRQIRAEVEQLGPRAPYESIRRIREAWDKPAKVKYLASTSADALKSQGHATAAVKGTGALRDALAGVDPVTAEANAKYSLYKTADDVLEATKEVERTRPKVGRQIMARLTGSVVGGEAAGATGAVAGYVLGPIADAAAGAGFTTKLQTARLMSQLASVIRTGDIAAVDALVGKIRRLVPGKTTLASRATNPNESQKPPALTPTPQGIR